MLVPKWLLFPRLRCYNETACFIVMISIPKCLFLENWVISNKLLCILHAFLCINEGWCTVDCDVQFRCSHHTILLLMVINDQTVHLILRQIVTDVLFFFFNKPPVQYNFTKYGYLNDLGSQLNLCNWEKIYGSKKGKNFSWESFVSWCVHGPPPSHII
jgi:hypothetical protein